MDEYRRVQTLHWLFQKGVTTKMKSIELGYYKRERMRQIQKLEQLEKEGFVSVRKLRNHPARNVFVAFKSDRDGLIDKLSLLSFRPENRKIVNSLIKNFML
jgi:hypothetical protein